MTGTQQLVVVVLGELLTFFAVLAVFGNRPKR